jgi:phytoene/squalene synthetase
MKGISAEKTTYLSERMAEVSRSFALVVRCLETPLDDYMATAYLLCRVADNFEDCTRSASWKQSRFAEFTDLLHRPGTAEDVLAEWERLEWPGLTPDESRMMGLATGPPLWDIYERMDGDATQSIRRWVSTMARGMVDPDDPHATPHAANDNGKRYLATVSDYNEYCYYVAGTVGHLATELVAQHHGFTTQILDDLRMLSGACGRGLQKTNIVKDFKDDLRRGISYLPGTWLADADFEPLHLKGASMKWTRMVIQDLIGELRDAIEYVLRLPTDARGYRMASLLCLSPAYETVLQAAQRHDELFTNRHHVKISRLTMVQCQSDARTMLSDNEVIREFGRRMQERIEAAYGAD